MADIVIKLDSATKEFAASLREANENITALVAELKLLIQEHKKEAEESRKAAAADQEASALRVQAARQLTADKRKAAEESKRLAKEETEARKKAEKEAADFGKGMLEEADRMKKLFLDNQKEQEAKHAQELKKIREAEELGQGYLDQANKMHQQFLKHKEDLEREAQAESKRIEKEKLDFGRQMVAESDRMKKMFLDNEKKREKQASDDKKKIEKEKLDFGRGMLAEADRMKKMFLDNEKKKEKQASDEKKKLLDEEREAKRRATQEAIALQRQQLEETKKLANATAFLTNVYNAAFSVIRKAFSAIGGGIKDAIDNVDEFKRNTIGTAAAITNLADPTLKFGKTWNEVFNTNLKETQSVYIELERLAASYFSTANDLQLAYNAFAQRGIVIRQNELRQLAQLTDVILLLTQGQQTSIQVQEEIRSLVTGTLRPTAQLAQIVRSFGLDVKQVSEEIRRTQSLKPLEGILEGAKAASGEIQKTFTAALNGLTTIFRQIERIGASVLYEKIVEQTRRLTNFLQNNRETIVRIFGLIGAAVEKAASFLEKFLEDIFTADGKIGPALDTMIQLTAVVLTLGEAFGKLVHAIVIFSVKLPATIKEMIRAFKEAKKEAESLRTEAEKPFVPSQKGVPNTPGFGGGAFSVPFPTVPEPPKAPLPSERKGLTGGILGMIIGPEGEDNIKGIEAAAGVLGAELEKSFANIFPTTFEQDLESMTNFIKSRIAAVLKELGKLNEASSEGFVGTRIPFKISEEEEARLKTLKGQNEALAEQVAKGKRALDNVRRMAQFDVEISDLRRELALIEQGFTTFTGTDGTVITGLRSIEQEISLFKTEFADAFTFDIAKIPFEALQARITALSVTLTQDIFANLIDQYRAADNANKEFTRNIKENTLKAIEEVRKPLIDQAQKLESKAKEALEKTDQEGQAEVQRLQNLLDLIKKLQGAGGADAKIELTKEMDTLHLKILQAEESLRSVNRQMNEIGEAARKSGTKFAETIKASNFDALAEQRNTISKNLAELQQRFSDLAPILGAKSAEALQAIFTALAKEQATANDRLFAGLANAQQALKAAEQEAALLREKAALEETKLTQQEKLQLAEAEKKIAQEKLRIRQQEAEVQGKVLLLTKQVDALLEKRKTETTKGVVPQSPVNAARQQVADERTAFEKELATAEGQLIAFRENLKELAVFSPLAAEEMGVLLDREEALLNQRRIYGTALYDEAAAYAVLTPQIEAVAQAAVNASNVLIDSLLQSFEGGKPDIVRSLKGVTDTLFKDSLKPALESLKESTGKAMKSVFDSIGVEDKMAETLGPAFVAGFALIASFVLGQLLGGNKSSATAANPQVGIQSSEQVRGLIGGETQIPIGLVGESLQEALVPTNALLSRIARGVESISLSTGLSSDQVESAVAKAVTESIQISAVSV